MWGSTRRIGGDAVLTAADVRVRATQVRTFRARLWPLQRPAALPAPAAPALPALVDQDIDALRARLLALAPPALRGRITVRRVLEVAAGHFGTTVDALLSERRTQSLSCPRQIAMFVARKVTGRSLPSSAAAWVTTTTPRSCTPGALCGA